MHILYYNAGMKLMAVDYGSKRVGIASTDESGEFAIPRMVLENTDDLVSEVIKFVKENKIEKVVVGESRNLDGSPNPILEEVDIFVDNLRAAGLDVMLHTEVYTSLEAERLQGKNAMLDASAAAIILKSYIDTNNL